MSAEPERRLAAILSADVAGYSRLMADDEDATVRALRATREQVAALITEHRGHLADFTGDNFLAEFAAARDAVECALEIQRVLEARNSALPEPRRMRFRIGGHLGDVRHEDGRVFGDGVNIAARLQPLAEPGGLCISSTLADVVRGKLAIALEDIGEQALKNIPEPVHAFRVRPLDEGAPAASPATRRRRLAPAVAALAVAAIVGSAYLASDRAPEPLTTPPPEASDLAPIRSLAVLPLTNLSGDPEQEFFADGMTETLIAELAKLPGVRVISRTSVMQFKGTKTALPEIAKTLNVDGVIEGSVMRAGNEVRITAQLIDARADRHLWSEQYDRELARVLEIQSEVARAVAAQIRLALTPEQSARLEAPRPVDPRAQDEYLRGLVLRQRYNPDDLARAAEALQEAIRIQPDFAPAHAALSITRYLQIFSAGRAAGELRLEAKRAALRAVELDDFLGEAHMALGRALMREYDLAGAEREFQRGIELGVSDAVQRSGWAFFLDVTHRRGEALAVLDQTVASAPLDLFVRAQRLSFWAIHRDTAERAIAEAETMLGINPTYSAALFSRRIANERLGNFDAAVRDLMALAKRFPAWDATARACEAGLREHGPTGYWRALARADRELITLQAAAGARAQAGEIDAAFAALEEAYQTQDGTLLIIGVDPLLDPIRDDPRFIDLMRRLNLPPAPHTS